MFSRSKDCTWIPGDNRDFIRRLQQDNQNDRICQMDLDLVWNIHHRTKKWEQNQNTSGKMAVATWIDGLLRWPRLEVVWRGSCPSIMVCGLMRRNASITTFPFTLWIGSTTTATARWFKASKLWNHEQNTHQGVNSYSWIRHENMCAKISAFCRHMAKTVRGTELLSMYAKEILIACCLLSHQKTWTRWGIKNITTISNIQWVSLSEEDWAFKTSLKDHTLSMIPVYQISSIIFSWTLVYLLSIYVHAW